jgi:TolC family type I secretion outer membrane protein
LSIDLMRRQHTNITGAWRAGTAIAALVLAFSAAALWVGPAHAGPDLADPFSVGALTSQTQAGGIQMQTVAPCRFDSAAQAALALADVVERALCNNPQTHQAWATARFQAAQLGVARSAFLPSVSATGSLSRNRSDGAAAIGAAGGATSFNEQQAGIALSYLLYDFGQRDATLENARQVLAAANASQDATVQSVFLSALQAYYQLFAAQAAADATKESERSSLQSLNAATARYGFGTATPADKLQAQTAYSQAVLNRIQAEGTAKTAEGTLANVMGLDANRLPSIVAPTARVPSRQFERDLDRLIAEARQARPDLAAAEAQVKAAEANVEAAKASGRPTISLSTTWNYTNANDSPVIHSSAIGVSVNIPLFTGFATTYRVRAAQAQAAGAGAQRDLLRQEVALDVWKAYQSLVTQTQAVQSSEDLLTSATESERVASGRYRAGVGTILDVLTAQSALASARQQNIQALYTWYTAKAALAQAMGQLDFAAIDTAGTRR